MSLTLHEFVVDAATAILPVLPTLLKAYWILASASVLVTLLPIPLPAAFKAAVRLSASRGKLWHNRPAALGPLKDASVPQQYFEHFYLIGALATTVALQGYVFVCCEEGPDSTAKRDALLALLLFEVHVLRRYAETAYVMHYPESARMHLFAYLFGLSYYVAVPLTLLPGSVLDMYTLRTAWSLAVGEGTGHFKSVDSRLYAAVAAPHPGTARLVAGVALYLLATGLQFSSHRILGRLARAADSRSQEARMRALLFSGKDRQQEARGRQAQQQAQTGQAAAAPAPAPGTAVTDVYTIPRGGAFELVSCPHYLGEILIYAALAVVTRGSPGVLLILGWVVLNLVLAAGATQRWYRSHFPAYPPGRAALLPWVF